MEIIVINGNRKLVHRTMVNYFMIEIPMSAQSDMVSLVGEDMAFDIKSVVLDLQRNCAYLIDWTG